MRIEDWNIEELTGYEPKTTFYTDFSIAERFGKSAIKDTYKRAMAAWKTDTVFLTELVMVLNWKSFRWSGVKDDYCETYVELFEKADAYAMKHLKGEDLMYYFRTTD